MNILEAAIPFCLSGVVFDWVYWKFILLPLEIVDSHNSKMAKQMANK